MKSSILVSLFCLSLLMVACAQNSASTNEKMDKEFVTKIEESSEVTSNDDIGSKTQKLVIGYTEYPPYEHTDENGNAVGICVESVKEVLRIIGYEEDEYVFNHYPWERLLEMGKTGEIDVIIEGIKNEEREVYLDYSNEYIFKLDFDLIIKKESGIKIENNLLNKEADHVGVVRGYDYGEEAYAMFEKLGLQQIEVTSTVDLIEGMMNGRFDMIIEDENVVRYYLAQSGLHEFIDKYDLGEGENSYIFFPKLKDLKDLRDQFDIGIKRIHSDGTYEMIVKDYFSGIERTEE